MKKFSKKLLSAIMSLVVVLSTMALGISAQAATQPSLGSGCPSSITLYLNDVNEYYRAINIKVNNFVSTSKYTYTAVSSKESVAKITDRAVNSKTGIHFNVISCSRGDSEISIKIINNSTKKTVSSMKINVVVTTRPLCIPTSLKETAKGNGSITLSYAMKNKNYVSGYVFEVSTGSDFSSSNTKSYKLLSPSQMKCTITGLKRNTRYYVRMRSISIVNGKAYGSAYSSTLRAFTA